MKCEKCEKAIPAQIDYCPTCKVNETKNQNNQDEKIKEIIDPTLTEKQKDRIQKKEERIQREERIREILTPSLQKYHKRKMTSMLLLLIPLAFFVFTSDFKGYTRLIIAIPLMANVVALFTWIIGLHSKTRIFAVIGLSILTFLVIYL